MCNLKKNPPKTGEKALSWPQAPTLVPALRLGPNGNSNMRTLSIWLSANRSQNSTNKAETQATVPIQQTKGNRLFRFLLLSTQTRSVCPRCVRLDSAHFAYEPSQTGFLCFCCRPTTLLICEPCCYCDVPRKKEKKKKTKSKPKVNSEPAKPPSELIKMEKYCQEWFCRCICIKWKILKLAFLREKLYLAASARLANAPAAPLFLIHHHFCSGGEMTPLFWRCSAPIDCG